MLGLGALFAMIAWLGMRGSAGTAIVEGPPVDMPPLTSASSWGIAITAFAVLLAANVGIMQKEILISRRRPILVELAPADPRSLMQDDYMQLRFNLPTVSWGDGWRTAEGCSQDRRQRHCAVLQDA